jgi:hypothetical protein
LNEPLVLIGNNMEHVVMPLPALETKDVDFMRRQFRAWMEDGRYYSEITHLPKMMNSMMVFEVGGKPGVYYWGGMHQRSCSAKV